MHGQRTQTHQAHVPTHTHMSIMERKLIAARKENDQQTDVILEQRSEIGRLRVLLNQTQRQLSEAGEAYQALLIKTQSGGL